MAYRNRVAQQRAHLITLYIAWGFTALIAGGLWFGWVQASRTLPVLDIPPDLSRGASVRPGEYHPPNVYAFALSVWQGINQWEHNGEEEYPAQLFRFRPYLTPAFYANRLGHMERKAQRGELRNRKRALKQIPGHHYVSWRVETLREHTSWVVWLDFRLEEHHGSIAVKTPPMRYPLVVTVYDVDRSRNPFGLALAGFAHDGERRLTQDELVATRTPATTRGSS